MADSKNPRLILRNFLSLDVCKELEFIHKSSCTLGYRPNVLSTTLSHLIATNCAHLIIPLVPIREKLREKVEEHFGCEYELFIEFTGLISWCRGASIGWHSDDNRPYLRQRDFAAVCYLNSFDVDFKGGLFHFQDGEPSTLEPMAGVSGLVVDPFNPLAFLESKTQEAHFALHLDVAIYTADDRNIHSVDEVTEGERLTLTMWFTRNKSHDEDSKLISILSQSSVDSASPQFDPCIPLPASKNMYWFPPDDSSEIQSVFDIRYARLSVLGFELHPSQDSNKCPTNPDSDLDSPVQLLSGDELLERRFANVMHVLQVVHFYRWRASWMEPDSVRGTPSNVSLVSSSQRKKADDLKHSCLKDKQLAETFFSNEISEKRQFHLGVDWVGFSAAIADWEGYSLKLQRQLAMSLALWRMHQSIFLVSDDDLYPL